MVGTRFVVLRLKELIRIGIFTIAGLAVIIALALALTRGKRGDSPALGADAGEPPAAAQTVDSDALYTPGTYSARIILHNTPVGISVKVGAYAIEAVSLVNEDDFTAAFYPLFKPTLESLAQEIIRTQSTNLDAPPVETLYTSKILLDAVNSALSQAVVE